ncbi:MAG: methylenetetrahydrofolate reductase C-terminal domain-containing protein [bacterium]|nr:methylenetetrahydrofolate reductase C-terminal domain-containing protein [bacterium]
MIVCERKPIPAILEHLDGRRRVVIAGCSECVTVCHAGGEKEVALLRDLLLLAREGLEIETQVLTRQCDVEFLEALDPLVKTADCVISMACGVGVQFLAERYPATWVVPAVDTRFGGGSRQAGIWEERCGFCGDCVLHLTGGVCPIIRCSKSLLNGPCGGSQGGKCEIDKETDCAWQLIHDRLEGLGRLDLLETVLPPKDWSRARDGGPRKLVREDVQV